MVSNLQCVVRAAKPKDRFDYKKLWAQQKNRERQKKSYHAKKALSKVKSEGEKLLETMLEYI